MTASSTTLSPRSARKRAAILEAARRSFREQGYQGTTMDGVAAAAEVSKRTVYNHFAGKEELFSAVLQQLIDRTKSGATLTFDPEHPLDEQLAEYTRKKLAIEFDADYFGLFRAVIADLARHPGLGATTLRQLTSQGEAVAVWLQEAHRAGRLHVPNPIKATLQFWALLKGAIFWPVVAGLCEVPPEAMQEQAIADAVDFLLDHYRPERAGRA